MPTCHTQTINMVSGVWIIIGDHWEVIDTLQGDFVRALCVIGRTDRFIGVLDGIIILAELAENVRPSRLDELLHVKVPHDLLPDSKPPRKPFAKGHSVWVDKDYARRTFSVGKHRSQY